MASKAADQRDDGRRKRPSPSIRLGPKCSWVLGNTNVYITLVTIGVGLRLLGGGGGGGATSSCASRPAASNGGSSCDATVGKGQPVALEASLTWSPRGLPWSADPGADPRTWSRFPAIGSAIAVSAPRLRPEASRQGNVNPGIEALILINDTIYTARLKTWSAQMQNILAIVEGVSPRA